MRNKLAILTGLAIGVAMSMGAQDAPEAGGPKGPGFGPRGPGGPGGPGGPHHGPPPIMIVLDTDKDGILSAAEIDNSSTVLAALDANKDGQVDAQELLAGARAKLQGQDGQEPPPPPAGKGKGPMGPRSLFLPGMDADGDGVLSAAEIQNAPAALKALDLNHDGQLTRNELRPPGGPGPGQRPPGPPPTQE